jgi:hypothetical protein
VSTVIFVFGDNSADKQEGGKNLFVQSATRKMCFLVLRLYRSHVSYFEIHYVINMCACLIQFIDSHSCFV